MCLTPPDKASLGRDVQQVGVVKHGKASSAGTRLQALCPYSLGLLEHFPLYQHLRSSMITTRRVTYLCTYLLHVSVSDCILMYFTPSVISAALVSVATTLMSCMKRDGV